MIGKCNTNLCHWHNTGKPMWWDGKFFVAGCRRCEANAEKDPSVRSAPTPEQAFEQYRQEGRKKGQRSEVAKRRKAARAAMTRQWHENLPGRAA